MGIVESARCQRVQAAMGGLESDVNVGANMATARLECMRSGRYVVTSKNLHTGRQLSQEDTPVGDHGWKMMPRQDNIRRQPQGEPNHLIQLTNTNIAHAERHDQAGMRGSTAGCREAFLHAFLVHTTLRANVKVSSSICFMRRLVIEQLVSSYLNGSLSRNYRCALRV